jgi:hypothetical protein
LERCRGGLDVGVDVVVQVHVVLVVGARAQDLRHDEASEGSGSDAGPLEDSTAVEALGVRVRRRVDGGKGGDVGFVGHCFPFGVGCSYYSLCKSCDSY